MKTVKLSPVITVMIASSITVCFAAGAEGRRADLSRPVAEAAPTDLGQGTNVNPAGETITADSRSFFLNGRPWMPIAGEIHYSRYPRQEWRDALLKMKAGGIDVVSTYVFWIHHEERQGAFDWSDRRDLRAFVRLCGELGFKVIVRMGPWCHGEVRNGGLPDWVQHSGAKLRTTDPAFMAMVEPLYEQIAGQIEGLLWKDGGPVIGVQHDNERNDVPYLLALKALARSKGVDVPLYTMTGWNRVAIPASRLLPLFGAYSVSFWTPVDNLNFRKSFVFTDIRDDGDMGAQFVNLRPGRVENMERYPYACCEIGGGMPSSYRKRIKVSPDEIAAMALVRLGCGSNMPGYYMYHGGVNPDGGTWLNEDHPNPMAVKDYDFQAPLGAFGQVREHYHRLRMQHLFVQNFGERLARMPLFLPEVRPADLDDVTTLRWSVRSDGEAGFVFFNNYQPQTKLPAKEGVQFELKLREGVLTFPAGPMTIPEDAYGLFPFNLDCNGVRLEYATAQPLCRAEDGEGNVVYFFAAIEGIAPELMIRAKQNEERRIDVKQELTPNGLRITALACGTRPVARVKTEDGKTVSLVVLSPEQSRRLWRLRFGGRDRLVLCDDPVIADGETLRVQTGGSSEVRLSVYPPMPIQKATPSPDGVFARYSFEQTPGPSLPKITATPEKEAGPAAYALKGMDESTWEQAAVWKLNIPAELAGRKVLLDLHYIGDAARLYVGDTLFDDNFYNGDPFAAGLWRIPETQWSDVYLKVLPYSEGLESRLPAEAKRAVAEAQAAGTLHEVAVTVIELREMRITAP